MAGFKAPLVAGFERPLTIEHKTSVLNFGEKSGNHSGEFSSGATGTNVPVAHPRAAADLSIVSQVVNISFGGTLRRVWQVAIPEFKGSLLFW